MRASAVSAGLKDRIQRWSAAFHSRGSLAQDMLSATFSNGAVLLSAVVAYALAARYFSQEELSQYMLIRRVTNAILAVVMLGMPVALSRYVALLAHKDKNYIARAMLITTSVELLSLGVLWTVCLAFPQWASSVLLGDAGYFALLAPVLLIVAANGLLGQLLYYFMGQLQIRMANAVQIIIGGVAPLLPLVVFAHLGLQRVLYLVGVLGLIGCVPFAISPVMRCARQLRRAELFSRQGWIEARQLLAYGLSRTPGFSAMAVLWSAVPLHLTRLHETNAVTYVLAGIQVLLLTSITLSPISSVLLPRVADMQGAGAQASLSRGMSLAHRLMLQLGVLVMLQVPVAVPTVAQAWLLIDNPQGLNVIMLVALAVPAFAAYSILRNPIDGTTHVPVNTYNIAAALGLQLLVLWGLLRLGVTPAWAGGIALLSSFFVLGVLTLICSIRLFEPRGASIADRPLYGAIALAVLWLALGLGLNYILAGQALWLRLAVLVLYELLVFGLSMLVLYRLRAEWLLEVLSKLRSRLQRAPAVPRLEP